MDSALMWLLFNTLSIVILAFYSMLEMAAVSVNKVRLQYWVSRGSLRARWLSLLLQNPSRLFGTTLIGVNVATVVGSECSREFYAAIGLPPNLAPLTQVLLLVIFGELAPMFAARHYPEHVATLGVPLIYASSRLLAPIIWVLTILSRGVMSLFGQRVASDTLFLSEEELEKVLELRDDEGDREGGSLKAIASNIFRLKGKDISHVMRPLASLATLPSSATIQEMKALLASSSGDYVPIYYKQPHNIVAIARPRNLIRASAARRVRDFTKSPWFVTLHTPLPKLLEQFRRSKEDIAVVLDQAGHGVGIVTITAVLEEIFGKEESGGDERSPHTLFREKTFPGSTSIANFNALCEYPLEYDPVATLSELITDALGHAPEMGDSANIGHYEFTVKKTSFLEIESVTVTSRSSGAAPSPH